jgi:hypothetical protein
VPTNLNSAMTKAVLVSIGFVLIMTGAFVAPAQTNSPADMAVTEAVLRQANTVVLRQKLVQAREAMSRGDVVVAAKLYEDAYQLVQQIGSGIPNETAQTISGLVAARFELAREAQRQGDLQEANIQISRVLKVDPQDAAAIEFKKQNDRLIAAQRGKVPDEATLQQVPAINNEKTEANTLVRDGKLLYEMGKFEEAEVKLEQALKLDPLNEGAFYYLNLVKQGVYAREERQHTVDDETRIVQVTKAWETPVKNTGLPVPNPYATNDLIHTGPGREEIMNKLNRIRLNRVFYDGLPLSEVVRDLSDQAKLRDPDKVGINFLINPNPDLSASVTTTAPPTGTGGPGGPGSFGAPGQQAQPAGQQIDATTGLPINTVPTTGNQQPVDINSVIIRINPALHDIRLADALDAIVQVASSPIEYSINDYAVVFSAKGPNSPQLYSRTFRVDPNTFVQGLQAVEAEEFVNNNSSSGNGSGSSGGGGGSNSGNGNNNNSSVGVVAIVQPAPGGIQGGNGSSGGSSGGSGNGQNNGGLQFVTTYTNTVNVSEVARDFFSTLGVDLNPPKSIFFNDRLGLLFVRATMQDLDTIESAIQALNQVAPQVHIATRFIEVDQTDNEGLGFQWYLGQFNIGNSVAAQGGSAPSLNVPGPGGTTVPFPGPTAANEVSPSSTDQQITSGLSTAGPAIATITGILTNPNFRVVIQALQQRSGFEELAAPEVTTLSGRQTEMKAVVDQYIVTSFSFQQGTSATTTGGTP